MIEKFLTPINQKFWGSVYSAKDSCTHWHEFYEMEIILEGAANENINGNNFFIPTNTLTLFSPNDFHSIRRKECEQIVMLKCCAKPDCLSTELNGILKLFPTPYVLNLTDRDIGLFKTYHKLFLEEIVSEQEYSEITVKRLAELMILEAAKIASRNGDTGYHFTDNEKMSLNNIRLIIQYIDDHYFEKIKRDDIADELHFSPNYLSSLFKKMVGKSLSEHIIDVRMNEAMRLIKSGNESIREVISSVGYKSPSLFYKHFHKKFGINPYVLKP